MELEFKFVELNMELELKILELQCSWKSADMSDISDG